VFFHVYCLVLKSNIWFWWRFCCITCIFMIESHLFFQWYNSACASIDFVRNSVGLLWCNGSERQLGQGTTKKRYNWRPADVGDGTRDTRARNRDVRDTSRRNSRSSRFASSHVSVCPCLLLTNMSLISVAHLFSQSFVYYASFYKEENIQ